MKKVIGWILIACGLLSLPNFFMNLSRARDSYTVVGMLIGQGLIFFLAYLCLRKPKEKMPSSTPYNVSKDLKTTLFQDHLPSVEKNEVGNRNVETENKYERSCDMISKDYYCIYEELMDKCNPANYMDPYDSDKVEAANHIYAKVKINKDYLLGLLKLKDEAVEKLGTTFSSDTLFKELARIYNPKQFVNDAYDEEKLSKANEMYSLIQKNRYNEDELRKIVLDSTRIKDDDNTGTDNNKLGLWVLGVFVWIIIIIYTSHYS